MAKLKAFLDGLFNSPYLSKIDVAAVLAAAVVLFQFHLDAVQQAAAVLLLATVFMVAKAIENALPSK